LPQYDVDKRYGAEVRPEIWGYWRQWLPIAPGRCHSYLVLVYSCHLISAARLVLETPEWRHSPPLGARYRFVEQSHVMPFFRRLKEMGLTWCPPRFLTHASSNSVYFATVHFSDTDHWPHSRPRSDRLRSVPAHRGEKR